MNTPKLTISSLLAFSLLLTGCGKEKGGTDVAVTVNDGENPYAVPFSSPDYLKAHARYLEEELFQIGDTPVWDYNTPNRGFGNVIMIEGDDGLIIIDTTTATAHAAVAERAFRDISDKPVKAVIYTHHHADHISGAGAFIDRKDAESGAVQVIASENFLRELEDENQVTAPIMGVRALYMYGQLLDPVTDGRDYHISCCGYTLGSELASYVPPNHFIRGSQELTIAGIRMELFQTGGESASHLAVWLPDYRVMLSGDEIQGPNYPNLHSLRGTKPRDAMKWISAIDRMRAYDAQYLVPSHGQPVEGRDDIQDVLTIYRDAIQYTHDQSLRLINKGYTPDDLANAIALPPSMDRDPWTREMYGTVKHNVREFYVAYISWWNGDPAELDPLPRLEKARRLVELMGGRDRVLAEAEKAFEAEDDQWAAELTAYLVRMDREDMQARYLKAAALRRVGFNTANTNWRGFYLTAARELEGSVVPREVLIGLQKKRFNPSQLNTAQLLSLLRFRVDAEAAEGKTVSVAYELTDTNEVYTLQLRNSILDIQPVLAADADVTLRLDRALLDQLFIGDISYADAISNDLLAVEGSKLKLRSFGQAFDRDPGHPYLSLR
ncbi:alkyl sulfatase dimerization domain-containing protein [Congregibacter litoralis]|uniref:Alkyl sulfatase n=1 Tax=Congregibacter litoralis KT71 TaxID=314285 RepID=A4A7J2_9GAMM|nr:alkyl sulfatase dimerization domain-containing protein [Congregibacter litoralis]EAQ98261.1 Alkyl sulfatase [Congregibacter litoralis KT71]